MILRSLQDVLTERRFEILSGCLQFGNGDGRGDGDGQYGSRKPSLTGTGRGDLDYGIASVIRIGSGSGALPEISAKDIAWL